jgi:uncharacterized protein (DUF983 family)
MVHNKILTLSYKCQTCTTGKLLAGIYCFQCDADMCRVCSRRLHSHSTTANHDLCTI